MVTYTFRGGLGVGESRKAWMLLTAVQPSGRKYAPRTERTVIRRASGRIVQPLGLGRGPFKLRVTVLAADGTRSKTVTVLLR